MNDDPNLEQPTYPAKRRKPGEITVRTPTRRSISLFVRIALVVLVIAILYVARR